MFGCFGGFRNCFDRFRFGCGGFGGCGCGGWGGRWDCNGWGGWRRWGCGCNRGCNWDC